MKKIYSFIMLMAALMTTTNAMAGNDNYYATETAQAKGTGSGLVYVSDKEETPKFTSDKASKQQVQNTNNAPTFTFYSYAQAIAGSEFAGWFNNENGEGEAISTEAKVTRQIKGTTNDNNGETIYAIFNQLPNTLLFDTDYKFSGVVSLADGIDEAKVPEAFKKYLENGGNYEVFATIVGDEDELIIKNNTEEGILNGFSIKGDAIRYTPEKNFVLDEKTFTIANADGTDNNNALKIAAVEGEEKTYTLEDLSIVYGAYGVIGYIKNIKIEYDPTHTAVNTVVEKKNSKTANRKYVKNGNIVIEKDGKKFSVNGVELK